MAIEIPVARQLMMEGAAMFNFVVTEVTQLIGGLLAKTGTATGDADAVLFHQPTRSWPNTL